VQGLTAVKFIAHFVLGNASNAVMALLGGWMLMIAVGVAHAHWVPALPTIGYWWAALIVWLLQGSFRTIDLDRK
jgi:hypothetical protein